MRFWDTSGVIKLLVQEPDTVRARELLGWDEQMAVWWCTPVECWSALARLRTPGRVVLLHYSPVIDTVDGEPSEIYPFLGSSRLEEPVNRYAASVVFHGHAHRGQPEGKTAGGVGAKARVETCGGRHVVFLHSFDKHGDAGCRDEDEQYRGPLERLDRPVHWQATHIAKNNERYNCAEAVHRRKAKHPPHIHDRPTRFG